jgi:DNA-binding Lrp family transcriptional regulator
MTVRDIDRKILRQYLLDSRKSSREIAEKVGVSSGTVLTRTKRMENCGLIKGYTVKLNHEHLGYQLTAITEIAVSKGRVGAVGEKIARMPMVCAVYNITGLTDAMVIAKFKTREELSNFTKLLLEMPFVERTNTHIVLKTFKEGFGLL